MPLRLSVPSALLASCCALFGCSDSAQGSKKGNGSNSVVTSADMGESVHDANVATAGRTIMVALGDLGRSTISCDGGRTWVADTDLTSVEAVRDDVFCGVDPGSLRCEDGPCTVRRDGECAEAPECACSEAPFVFEAGAYAQGWLFKQVSGRDLLQRSRDGVDWEIVANETRGPTSAVFAAGERLVRIGLDELTTVAWVSDDEGATWTEQPAGLEETFNPWKTFDFRYDGQTVGLVFDTVGRVLRTEDGSSFELVDLPSSCRLPPGVFVTAGKVVTINPTSICVSEDGGRTFTEREMNLRTQMHADFGGTNSSVTTDGTAHYLTCRSFGRQGPAILRTEDGENWEDIGSPGREIDLNPIVFEPAEDRFVAWRGSFDSQSVWVSPDGVSWTEAAATFTKSHTIRQLFVVEVPDDFSCPGSPGSSP